MKKRITQVQAQKQWDEIRNRVRLAKYNDDGIELPAIDMGELFNGRKYATPQDISQQLKDIINRWNPV